MNIFFSNCFEWLEFCIAVCSNQLWSMTIFAQKYFKVNVDLNSASAKPHPMRSGKALVRGITQFYLATHTFIHEWNKPSYLYSVSIHQMASPERGSAQPITAHYSCIDLEKMKGWVGLVGWPCSEPSSVGQEKFAGHRPTFYHCANQTNKLACDAFEVWWGILLSIYDKFTTNLLLSLPMKEFWKSDRIWQS